MTTKIDGNNGVLQSYDYQVLTTGFSYTFATGITTLIAAPAGTLATGTITMPGSPADGMVVTFTTTQEITALTISGNAGQSIGGTQVSLMAANSSLSFVYRQANTTWYKSSGSALGNVGTAPVYAARAWVNFNGTGTVAIRASGNVTSITDNGTGDYTVNFTNAMPDANYSAVGSSRNSTTRLTIFSPQHTGVADPFTTTTARFRTSDDAGSVNDSDIVSVSIFR